MSSAARLTPSCRSSRARACASRCPRAPSPEAGGRPARVDVREPPRRLRAARARASACGAAHARAVACATAPSAGGRRASRRSCSAARPRSRGARSAARWTGFERGDVRRRGRALRAALRGHACAATASASRRAGVTGSGSWETCATRPLHGRLHRAGARARVRAPRGRGGGRGRVGRGAPAEPARAGHPPRRRGALGGGGGAGPPRPRARRADHRPAPPPAGGLTAAGGSP